MSFKVLRSYSTAAANNAASQLGVHVQGSTVSVLAPRMGDAIELFTAQKQADREAVLQKLESALLYKQLNRRNRKLVFAAHTAPKWAQDDAPVFQMALGTKKREIKLVPRKNTEALSKRDLRTVSFTGHEPDDVRESVDLLLQYVFSQQTVRSKAYDEPVNIITDDLFAGVLRRAAAAGIFEEVYQTLVTSLRTVKSGSAKNRSINKPNSGSSSLSAQFYVEAMRIYALRMPFLSQRAKTVLGKMHDKADDGTSARDLLMAYGLVKFGQKFGKDKVEARLVQTLERIQSEVLPLIQASPREILKQLRVTDIVLAQEAVKLAQLPQFAPLEKQLADILVDIQGDRPLEQSYVVDISDRPADEVVAENAEETAEEAAEQKLAEGN